MFSIEKHSIKVLYLILAFLQFPILGQSKDDSIVQSLANKTGAESYQTLTDLSKKYLFIDADKTITYAQDALRISAELKDDRKIAVSYYYIGYGKYRKEDYIGSLKNFNLACDYYKKLNDEMYLARTRGLIALVYTDMQRFDMALDILNQLLAFFSQNNALAEYSTALLNTSNIFMAKKDYDQALEGYLKVLEIQKKINLDNKDLIATAYCNIGEAYYWKKEYDKSYKYRKMSLDIYKDLNFTDGIANLQMDVGSSLIKLKDYNQAHQYLIRALENYKSIKFSEGIRRTKENIILLYKETGQLDEALQACAELVGLSISSKDSTILSHCYNLYADIYFARDNYRSASEYYKKYIDLKDKLDSKENKQRMMELQAVFSTEEKEFENKTLRQENELQKEKLNAKESILIAVFAGIILAGILLFTLFLKEKKIKKINDEIKKQNIQLEEHIVSKDKFFSILAHNLKNPFWAILGQNRLLEEEYNNLDEIERKELISHVGISAKNVYNLFEDLLQWAKSQRSTTGISKKPVLIKELIESSIKPYLMIARNKKINIEIGGDGNVEINADKFMLETVIGNLVDNAIKYSNQNEKIIIDSREMEEQVEISIRDSGAGMSKEKMEKLFKLGEDVSSLGTMNEKGTGLGLIICKEFVEKHNGRIVVDSREGEGTTFMVILPRN